MGWKWENECNTPTYAAWVNMRLRCKSQKHPLWKHYGGRGISVCDRWVNDFDAFVEDMGLRPLDSDSLDRIDNEGDYTPENCRWTNWKTQARNKRSNRTVKFEGKNVALSYAVERSGMKYSTVKGRLDLGLSIKEALAAGRLRQVKHGSKAMYRDYHCRCEMCREHVNAYARLRRAQKKAAVKQLQYDL